ncbi:MAG: hypothetical protein SNJ77_10265, partial [Cytophagales bacterium]
MANFEAQNQSFMFRQAILLIFLFWFCFAQSQSNPTPFDLSTGNYSFTAWPANSTAGTYPGNMVFHFTKQPEGTQVLEESGTSDYTCAYNLGSVSRINGLGNNGFSFVNTGNGRSDACAGTPQNDKFVGAAVLSLNTTNRNNIQVSWIGGTVVVNGRIYVIQLQYRVGTSGNFTNLSSVYTRNSTAGHSQAIGPETLPEECENKSVVQLRWIYYQTEVGAGGTRPELRVDEISVTSSANPKIVSNTPSINFGNVVRNTTKLDSIEVNAYNLSPVAGNITATAPIGYQVSLSRTTGFANSVNIAYSSGALASTKLYIRFTPTDYLAYNANLSLSGGTASRNVALSGAGVRPNTVSAFTINRTAPDRMNLTWTKPAGVFGTDWDGVVVFARENVANAITLENVDGTAFSGGGNVFGSGTLQNGSYCVSRTTTDSDGNLTVTGLSFNQTYHFVAYAYKTIPGGSNDEWSLASTPISAQAIVMNVTNFEATPLNQQASLSWTNPFTSSGVWFNEILLVGKAGSDFSFSPAGDGSTYTANQDFSSGTEVSDGAFVVFKSTSSNTIVTNLNNGTNYFFRAFVRVGNNWSSGVLVEVTPTLGNVYYSCANGNHSASIWSLNNPACPTTTTLSFNSTVNITIQNGHTVTLNESNVNVNNITVASGGKLFSNTVSSTPRYMNLYGNVICNGEIGGANDGFSLNIEDGNHIISGNGIIRMARIRKSDENGSSGVGNLTINSNIQLSWNGAAIYINRQAANIFNVTINEGKTVELTNSVGDIAIDGTNGAAGTERGGTITVNGTLIIPNTYFAYTNNSNVNYPCKLVIGSTGYVRTGFLTYNASGSGNAKHTLEIKSGGVLEITNQSSGEAMVNFSSTNNEHIFETGSSIVFSRSGNQNFVNTLPYKHLTFSGSSNKTYGSGNLTIEGNLNIEGTAVLSPPSTSILNLKGNWSTASVSSFNPQSTTVNLTADSIQQITSTHISNKTNLFHQLNAGKLKLNS